VLLGVLQELGGDDGDGRSGRRNGSSRGAVAGRDLPSASEPFTDEPIVLALRFGSPPPPAVRILAVEAHDCAAGCFVMGELGCSA
jgi:hypothetical protein